MLRPRRGGRPFPLLSSSLPLLQPPHSPHRTAAAVVVRALSSSWSRRAAAAYTTPLLSGLRRRALLLPTITMGAALSRNRNPQPPSPNTNTNTRGFAAAAANKGGGGEGGLPESKVKKKASTSSRTALTVQGLSFALNKLRRHPTQAEGDEHSVRRPTPVVMDGRFYNPWNTDAAMKSFTDFVNLMRDRRGWPLIPPSEELANLRAVMVMGEEERVAHLKAIQAHAAAMRQGDLYGQGIRVTWINHSSVLVQMAGFTFLTDPIWSERCSPFQFAGPRRTFSPPYSLSELPPIDFVLISHNHYDHLDIGTLRQLGPKPTYYVPLGIRDWMVNRGFTNCVELGWWDEGTVTKRDQEGNVSSLRIACTPAQHWSSRTPFDRMRALWCSWAVMTEDEEEEEERQEEGATNGHGQPSAAAEGSGVAPPRQRFYFGGDSGYCPGFKEIGDEYGPFDIAAIPIGAYVPRWFMRDQHIDPQAALDVARDIQARHAFGIHWGTFPLAGDAWNEGARELIQTRVDRGLADDSFLLLKPGESWRVGDKDRKPFLEHYRDAPRESLSH